MLILSATRWLFPVCSRLRRGKLGYAMTPKYEPIPDYTLTNPPLTFVSIGTDDRGKAWINGEETWVIFY